jgi:hypothetical protein
MEEGQTHKHFFPLSRFFTFLEFDFVLSAERSEQIVLEASWRFVSHFDAFHENSYGENIGRHACQPQTEIRICGLFIDVLVNSFQFGHKRRRKMTIL